MNDQLVIKSLLSGIMPGNNEIQDARLSALDVEMYRKVLYFDSLCRYNSESIGYAEFLERTHRIDANSKTLSQQVLRLDKEKNQNEQRDKINLRVVCSDAGSA